MTSVWNLVSIKGRIFDGRDGVGWNFQYGIDVKEMRIRSNRMK
ncbi:21899_t:CDS:1, partial [Racocetra persica]